MLWKDEERKESQYVIAVNELPDFCGILKELDNEELGLVSCLRLVLKLVSSC